MMNYRLFDSYGALVTELHTESKRGEVPDVVEYNGRLYSRFGIQENTACFHLATIQQFAKTR